MPARLYSKFLVQKALPLKSGYNLVHCNVFILLFGCSANRPVVLSSRSHEVPRSGEGSGAPNPAGGGGGSITPSTQSPEPGELTMFLARSPISLFTFRAITYFFSIGFSLLRKYKQRNWVVRNSFSLSNHNNYEVLLYCTSLKLHIR